MTKRYKNLITSTFKTIEMKNNLIKEYRVKNGLSQKEMAAKLKISQQRLSYYENGMQPPTDFVSAFRKATGVDLVDGSFKPDTAEMELVSLRKENEMLKSIIQEKDKRMALYEQMFAKLSK